MRTVLTLIAAASLATLAVAGPAFAGRAVTLKADVSNADGVVTLGDLFDGAGPAGRTAIANRTGSSVVLDATVVQAAARRAGLDWANEGGLHRIIVRAGTPVASLGSGEARGNTEVLTYTRSLSAGEIVQPTDLAWVKAAAAPGDAPGDANAVIGQVAKRPLRAGAPVSTHDTGAAQVIKQGDLVIVAYEADGISLRLEGKAMGAAGVGEVLTVQNTLSKKLIQTIVTGPGEAVVGPAAEQMKLTRSTRYAAR